MNKLPNEFKKEFPTLEDDLKVAYPSAVQKCKVKRKRKKQAMSLSAYYRITIAMNKKHSNKIVSDIQVAANQNKKRQIVNYEDAANNHNSESSNDNMINIIEDTDKKFKYKVIILVLGSVVALRKKIGWRKYRKFLRATVVFYIIVYLVDTVVPVVFEMFKNRSKYYLIAKAISLTEKELKDIDFSNMSDIEIKQKITDIRKLSINQMIDIAKEKSVEFDSDLLEQAREELTGISTKEYKERLEKVEQLDNVEDFFNY